MCPFSSIIIYFFILDVPVYRVSLLKINSTIVARSVNHNDGDLRINVNKNSTAVSGYDLWKVGIWASDHADGSGKKIGYTEQVIKLTAAVIVCQVSAVKLIQNEHSYSTLSAEQIIGIRLDRKLC